MNQKYSIIFNNKFKFLIMNKIKFAIIGIVCLTLFGYIQSCSDNTTEIEQIPNLEIPEEFNEVGILHNEGLKYVFNELRKAAIEYTKKPQLKGSTFLENREEFFKQATLKFCQHNKKTQSNFDLCKDVLEINNMRLKSGTTIINNPIIIQLLNEAKVVIDEYKENDLSILKVQLDAINRKAANTLSEQDAVVIYCATSTAYASYQYWMNNYKKWYFALHYPEILEQYNDDELNQLQLKHGQIDQIKTKGWLSDLWNDVESWFQNTANNLVEWWNNTGKDIVKNDFIGAAAGAVAGFEFGGTVFAAVGAVSNGIFTSAYTPY
jgi:hypothetical protein